jgi:hypothetical protein
VNQFDISVVLQKTEGKRKRIFFFENFTRQTTYPNCTSTAATISNKTNTQKKGKSRKKKQKTLNR